MSYDPFSPRLCKLIEDQLSKWKSPGAAFSVIYKEETWSKGFGSAQLQPPKPAQPETLWYACSTTKAVLCAAWAIYISSDENQSKGSEKITWSTPIAEIIRDDFVLQDPMATNLITLEDTMSHRTGFSRHDYAYGREGVRTIKDVTRNLRNLPGHTPLRSKLEYNNTMFVAASHALETVTGKSVSSVLKETLWKPLGMNDTYAGYKEAAEALKKGAFLARSYFYDQFPSGSDREKGHFFECPDPSLEEVSGAGFIISTVNDFAKWMRCLVTSSQPLTEALLGEVFAPRSICDVSPETAAVFDSDNMLYALGWFIGTYRRHKVCFHSGGKAGAGGMVMIVPELKWGVTFFASGNDTGYVLVGVLLELLDEVLKVPIEERTALTTYNEKVIESYDKNIKSFKESKKKLYPEAPEVPTKPPTLPMKDYAGDYINPAYGTLQISAERAEDCLTCIINDRTWEMESIFKHVNAELWLLECGFPHDPMKTARRGESKIGADGKVAAFGIAMEPALPDHLFWFTRRIEDNSTPKD